MSSARAVQPRALTRPAGGRNGGRKAERDHRGCIRAEVSDFSKMCAAKARRSERAIAAAAGRGMAGRALSAEHAPSSPRGRDETSSCPSSGVKLMNSRKDCQEKWEGKEGRRAERLSGHKDAQGGSSVGVCCVRESVVRGEGARAEDAGGGGAPAASAARPPPRPPQTGRDPPARTGTPAQHGAREWLDPEASE